MLTRIRRNWATSTSTLIEKPASREAERGGSPATQRITERVTSLLQVYPTPAELKAARKLLKKARVKESEDKTNKAKKLQKIIGDHELIIDLVRLKMEQAGFVSFQEDFLKKASDIRFVVPASRVDLFWIEFKKVLKNHVVNKAK